MNGLRFLPTGIHKAIAKPWWSMEVWALEDGTISERSRAVIQPSGYAFRISSRTSPNLPQVSRDRAVDHPILHIDRRGKRGHQQR